MRDPGWKAPFPGEVGVQLSGCGPQRPPEERYQDLALPPQTIIWVPVQTAACEERAEGAPAAAITDHVFEQDRRGGLADCFILAPQRIIRTPVQMIV